MCGIVGYIGSKQAYPILIKGLKRLEYRGYDSAGVGLISHESKLNVYKAKGKVSNLEDTASQKDTSGHTGIAHTRWATHGEPCQANAHPHLSQSGNLALVHNGIIENYATLREQLQEKGYTFKSSTDTEVLVQLIDYFQTTYDTELLEAIQMALHKVVGAYAIAVLDRRHPGQIIAARKSSPLVIGVGTDEFLLASDATPIVEYTDKVVYLQDGEIAILENGKPLKLVNLDNETQPAEIKKVDMNIGQLEKGGFPHFMLKEIFEQPECINDCMRGRINGTLHEVTLSAVNDHKEQLLNAQRFVIVACGSSIPRITDSGSYIHVGPEIGVASTKAFTGQVTVLTMFALTLGKEKGEISTADYNRIIDELLQIPEKITEVLKQNESIASLSRIFTYAHNFLYLGRGYSYPVALEGALKLKEISYIHAEGYPAAEMKHGPIALVDTEMPVVVIATQNAMYEKIVSNVQEIKARKGHIIALINKQDTVIRKIADECIEIPETLECLEPLVTTIPLQLLAYHIAVCKGKDVDQPRNLAKSVTVE